MTEPKERSAVHTTFTLERDYPVAPARVFAAFADSQARHRWFVHEEGWKLTEYDFDFRVGGRETGRFSQKGIAVYTQEALYYDIQPANRIVFAYSMKRDTDLISTSLVTIVLLSAGATGTKLVFTEQGAFLDGLDQASEREAGWNDLLDRLGREVGDQ